MHQAGGDLLFSPDISQRTLLICAFVQNLHFHDFKILTYNLIRCGFEITQALTMTKITSFAKPSSH